MKIGLGRRFAAAAMIGGALTASLTACGDDDDDGTESISFAVTDLQGMEELQREFGAFVGVLEEHSGFDVEFFPVNDRVAAAAALESDRVDFVFTGPAEYVVISEKTGAVPVVAIRRPDYHSCIYTTTESGITSVEELDGGKVAMTDIGSTSGHLGPSQLLVDAGLDPQEDVEVLTVGDTVHEALKRGDVDAVGVGCHDYDEFMASDDPANYTMLVEGETLPADVIVAREGVDEETIDTLRSTFEEHFDELLTAMLEGEDNAKFADAELLAGIEDSDYDVVRSMYEAIGVDDFSDFVGD